MSQELCTVHCLRALLWMFSVSPRLQFPPIMLFKALHRPCCWCTPSHPQWWPRLVHGRTRAPGLAASKSSGAFMHQNCSTVWISTELPCFTEWSSSVKEYFVGCCWKTSCCYYLCLEGIEIITCQFWPFFPSVSWARVDLPNLVYPTIVQHYSLMTVIQIRVKIKQR